MPLHLPSYSRQYLKQISDEHKASRDKPPRYLDGIYIPDMTAEVKRIDNYLSSDGIKTIIL